MHESSLFISKPIEGTRLGQGWREKENSCIYWSQAASSPFPLSSFSSECIWWVVSYLWRGETTIRPPANIPIKKRVMKGKETREQMLTWDSTSFLRQAIGQENAKKEKKLSPEVNIGSPRQPRTPLPGRLTKRHARRRSCQEKEELEAGFWGDLLSHQIPAKV